MFKTIFFTQTSFIVDYFSTKAASIVDFEHILIHFLNQTLKWMKRSITILAASCQSNLSVGGSHWVFSIPLPPFTPKNRSAPPFRPIPSLTIRRKISTSHKPNGPNSRPSRPNISRKRNHFQYQRPSNAGRPPLFNARSSNAFLAKQRPHANKTDGGLQDG